MAGTQLEASSSRTIFHMLEDAMVATVGEKQTSSLSSCESGDLQQ